MTLAAEGILRLTLDEALDMEEGTITLMEIAIKEKRKYLIEKANQEGLM